MPSVQEDRRVVVVLWAALLTGCLLFLGVAAFVRTSGPFTGGATPEVLAWLALALPVVLVAGSFVLPGRLRPAAAPPEVARVRLIVGWALREGGAMFATVVWLLSGDAKALAGATLAIAALAATMPTAERWRAAVQAAGGEGPRAMVR